MGAAILIQVIFIVVVSILSVAWPNKTPFFMWAMGFSFGFTLIGLLNTLGKLSQ